MSQELLDKMRSIRTLSREIDITRRWIEGESRKRQLTYEDAKSMQQLLSRRAELQATIPPLKLVGGKDYEQKG